MTCVVCGTANFVFFGEGKGYKLNRCNDCNFRVVAPLPSPEELKTFYEGYSTKGQRDDKKLDKKVARAAKRIKRNAHIAKGPKLINIGCSIGTAVAAAQTQGFDACGIDIDGLTGIRRRKPVSIAPHLARKHPPVGPVRPLRQATPQVG